MTLAGICAILALAVALYIAGEIKDKDSLSYVSSIFWLVGGSFSFSQQALNSMYVITGFGAVIIGLIISISTGVESLSERRKSKAEEYAKNKPKSFDEQLDEDRTARKERRQAKKSGQGDSLDRAQKAALNRL